jgi:hypothetical protein
MIKAKRRAPHIAEAIEVHGYRIHPVHHFGMTRENDHQGTGGYLEAIEIETGRKAWTQKLYDIVYKTNLERDVQDVYINSIHFDEKFDRLVVTDEKNRTYRIHWRDGRILP